MAVMLDHFCFHHTLDPICVCLIVAGWLFLSLMQMRATVHEVATYFPTAIISGRGRQKVFEFVQLPELFYAGSHGMDIMGPADGCNGFKATGTRGKDKKGNDIVVFQPASEYLPLINKVCKILEENTKDIEGAKIEHNLFCASVHFRRVKEEVIL
jgi:trehalose 6-phosphate phosphatase